MTGVGQLYGGGALCGRCCLLVALVALLSLWQVDFADGDRRCFSDMAVLLLFFQLNQKYNNRWTTEEQLLAVQGNT